MNKRLERMLKNYPAIVRERDSIAHQIAHFKGLSAEEVIDSMYTAHSDGERVQTSNLSDKTAQIAMNYQDKMERINREWYEHLERKLRTLNDEISFFKSSLDTLPEHLSSLMMDMIVKDQTWDTLEAEHHIGRATIHRYRRKAIALLDAIYECDEQETREYLLS